MEPTLADMLAAAFATAALFGSREAKRKLRGDLRFLKERAARAKLDVDNDDYASSYRRERADELCLLQQWIVILLQVLRKTENFYGYQQGKAHAEAEAEEKSAEFSPRYVPPSIADWDGTV